MTPTGASSAFGIRDFTHSFQRLPMPLLIILDETASSSVLHRLDLEISSSAQEMLTVQERFYYLKLLLNGRRH
jgi:hypothetical protein